MDGRCDSHLLAACILSRTGAKARMSGPLSHHLSLTVLLWEHVQKHPTSVLNVLSGCTAFTSWGVRDMEVP